MEADYDGLYMADPAVTIAPSAIKPNGLEPSKVSVSPIGHERATRETLARHGIQYQ